MIPFREILHPDTSSSLLLVLAKRLSYESKGQNRSTVENSLHLALQVLQTRKLGTTTERELQRLIRHVRRRSDKCYCDEANSQEVVGVPSSVLNDTGNRLHIYGYEVRRLFHRWQHSATSLDWPDYLASRTDSREKRRLRRNAVKYLSADEAKRYIASFHHGRIVRSNGRRYRAGRWMYVLDQTGKYLYLGWKKRGYFHHSSFVAGAPVLCAGFITFDRTGEIRQISLHSGHYKPDMRQGEMLLDFLADKSRLGPDIKHIKMIQFEE